jgi:hypothetical protein
MRLAKSIACGAAVLGLAIGSAFAAEGQSGMNEMGSANEPMAQDQTYIVLEPMDVTYYDVYGVDENGDGLIDGYLFIEESDTLG